MTPTLSLHDLTHASPPGLRLQRVLEQLQSHFHGTAAALLELEQDHLRPVASFGLVSDAMGRRFALAQHPRLAAIVARPREVTWFHNDSHLPDPYDGLIAGHAGEPLPVHDCMGIALRVDDKPWGVLTLDSLQVGTFDAAARATLQAWAAHAEVAIRMDKLENEVRRLRLFPTGLSGSEHDFAVHDIVGQSPVMQSLLQELKVVADSELPVLLTGETGVGKELFAHRLHQLSRRRQKPLVHVNCAALPDSLAESELFGHVKGAFSGALTDRPGRFEAADKGTLFLDEIGELSLPVQAKLLRALQNGEIQRLGSDRPKHLDVRVIAATNRDLQTRVREGTFRADLYHRISVYPVRVPPLRERGQDILLIAGRFLEINRGRVGVRALRLSDDAQRALLHYPWPGNVRELEHVISRATLKAISQGHRQHGMVTLTADTLNLDDSQRLEPPGADTASPSAPPAVGRPIVPLRQQVEAVQRQAIEQALAQHARNWNQAAQALGVDSSNLHKMAKRLGLKN